MRVAISLVVLISVLVIGVSLVQTSYGISNHQFELVWGDSGKINPGNFTFSTSGGRRIYWITRKEIVNFRGVVSKVVIAYW